jgi:subtilisin family serine protease
MKKVYYYFEKKMYLKVSETKLLVVSEKLDATGIKSVIENTHVDKIKEIIDMGGMFYIEMQHKSIENIQKLLFQLNANEDVVYASLVLWDDRNIEGASYTNEVRVCLKSKEDFPVLQKFAENYQIKEIIANEFDEFRYILILPHNPQKDAMDVAFELHETELFEYAIPNLICFWPLATADSYFNNQWALRNASTYGIKAESAWGISTGSSSIKIAIIDTGVNLSHPDLVGNLLTGYNGDQNATNTPGSPTNPTNSNDDFAHGTKCAGVAAAVANNNRGIAGVAYNCKIIPVTVCTSLSLINSHFERGIDLAAQNGADVLSISLGSSADNGVTSAINAAVNSGRNNRGCVVVVCAHNNNNNDPTQWFVRYPANLSNVIAVGATTANGQRRSNSRYGSELDVMAPGDDIYTTWMSGSQMSNYNLVIDNGGGDIYYTAFNSTSAACPHVAGVAALILSYNPNLWQSQVRNMIESTCSKNLPNFSVTQTRPNGTWNTQLGYGLVNAFAALCRAQTFYVGRNQSDVYGDYTMYVGSGGYAGITLYNFPQIVGLSYTWSAQFYGDCDGWFLWPYGDRADVSVYLSPGQSGGTLRILCEVFVGSTFVGSSYYYLHVYP